MNKKLLELLFRLFYTLLPKILLVCIYDTITNFAKFKNWRFWFSVKVTLVLWLFLSRIIQVKLVFLYSYFELDLSFQSIDYVMAKHAFVCSSCYWFPGLKIVLHLYFKLWIFFWHQNIVLRQTDDNYQSKWEDQSWNGSCQATKKDQVICPVRHHCGGRLAIQGKQTGGEPTGQGTQVNANHDDNLKSGNKDFQRVN